MKADFWEVKKKSLESNSLFCLSIFSFSLNNFWVFGFSFFGVHKEICFFFFFPFFLSSRELGISV